MTGVFEICVGPQGTMSSRQKRRSTSGGASHPITRKLHVLGSAQALSERTSQVPTRYKRSSPNSKMLYPRILGRSEGKESFSTPTPVLNTMGNEPKFDYGETVQIRGEEHKGRIGALVGISGEKCSRTYTVEFGDGSDSEIAEEFLSKCEGDADKMEKLFARIAEAGDEKTLSSSLRMQHGPIHRFNCTSQ